MKRKRMVKRRRRMKRRMVKRRRRMKRRMVKRLMKRRSVVFMNSSISVQI